MAYIPQNTIPHGNPGQPASYDPAYGGIPQLPPYTTDTGSTVGTDAQGQMIQNLPGYQGAVNQSMGNITSNLHGQVASDVAANLGTRAAEYGVGSGMPMSQASVSGFLARYGLTSDALTARGGQQLIAQMGATPMQQTQNTQQNTDTSAQQSVYNSAPVPSASAAASLRAAQTGIGAGRNSISAPSAPGAPGSSQAPNAGMGYGGFTGGSGGGQTPQGDASSGEELTNWLADMGLDQFGNQMPDYGASGQGSPYPDNTTYNPITDQSQYNYGLSSWDTGQQQIQDPAASGMMGLGEDYSLDPSSGSIFDDYSSWFE